jgi:hypothetical protein
MKNVLVLFAAAITSFIRAKTPFLKIPNYHYKQALSNFLDINYKSAYYMIQKLRKNNLQDFFQ